MSIKISHESPNSIFEYVQSKTDYDYFLVHLFDENPLYLEKYWKSKESGRLTILDNSIFELGKAFEMRKFAEKVIELKPDIYIIPDELEDRNKTVDNAEKWCREYRDKCHESKCMGVMQGARYSHAIDCYKYLDSIYQVDVIGISFDYHFYDKFYPHPNPKIRWTYARPAMINQMLDSNIINTSKPHHLLGCATPNEGPLYKYPEFNFIHTMDTSNPIVYGIMKGKYPQEGLYTKESKKLYTLINTEVTEKQLVDIENNIDIFRRLWVDL